MPLFCNEPALGCLIALDDAALTGTVAMVFIICPYDPLVNQNILLVVLPDHRGNNASQS